MQPKHQQPFEIIQVSGARVKRFVFNPELLNAQVYVTDGDQPARPDGAYLFKDAEALVTKLADEALWCELRRFDEHDTRDLRYLDWTRSFVGWSHEDLLEFHEFVSKFRLRGEDQKRLECLIDRVLHDEPAHPGAWRARFRLAYVDYLYRFSVEYGVAEATAMARRFVEVVAAAPAGSVQHAIVLTARNAQAFLDHQVFLEGTIEGLLRFQQALSGSLALGSQYRWVHEFHADNIRSLQVLEAPPEERIRGFREVVRHHLAHPCKPECIGVLVNREFQSWLAGRPDFTGIDLPEDPVGGFMEALCKAKDGMKATAFFAYRGAIMLMFAHAIALRGAQEAMRDVLNEREHELTPWDERKDARTLLLLFVSLHEIVGLPAQEVAERIEALAALRDSAFPEDVRRELRAKLAKLDADAAGKPAVTVDGVLGRVLGEAMTAVRADALSKRLGNFSDGTVVPWTDILRALRGLDEFESVELGRVLNHIRPLLAAVFPGGDATDRGVGIILGDIDLGTGGFSDSGERIVVGDLSCGTVFNCGPEDVLLVTGDLRCAAVHTSGQICVCGRATVRDYVYGEYNDQCFVVGNGLETRVYIDNDHGVNAVGGSLDAGLVVNVQDSRCAAPLAKLRAVFPAEFIVPWNAAHGEAPDADEARLPEDQRTWSLDHEAFKDAHAKGRCVFLDDLRL